MPIVVSSSALSGQDLLEEAAEELRQFEAFFMEKLDNQPLTPSEKAILKTYLHWAAVDRHQG
jgi:hypothetical protein